MRKTIPSQSEINDNLNNGVLAGFNSQLDIDQELPMKTESQLRDFPYQTGLWLCLQGLPFDY